MRQVLQLLGRDEVLAGVRVDDGLQGFEQAGFGDGHGVVSRVRRGRRSEAREVYRSRPMSSRSARPRLEFGVFPAAPAVAGRPAHARRPDRPQALRHHRAALCERAVPHRPRDGVHPGRHLGALPAHARAPGALRLRRRRPRRADHDRRREGRHDAAGLRRRDRRRAPAVLRRLSHQLRQLELDRRRRRTTNSARTSTARCAATS